jgi:branched-chain amino acid transport system permease protein
MTLVLQAFADGLVVALLYALIGFGFGLIYVACGVMHMAHGATYLVAGYALYVSAAVWQWPLVASIAAALGLSALTGVLWSAALYEPLLRRGTAPPIVLIASLGAFTVVQNVVVMQFGNQTQTVSTDAVVEGWVLGPVILTPLQLATAACSAALLAGVIAIVRWTALGQHIRAIANDPELAEVLGIRVRRARRIVFALGSALAAGAAVFSGLDVGVSPSSGLRVVLIAAAATILGGTHAIAGGIAGGVLVGLLETAGALSWDARWQNVIVFGAMVVGLLTRPQGLLGSR